MQPRLEIRHLLMLNALWQAGSLGAAAELLGVTQSALSHRLREAERRLGAKLAQRSGRGIALTPAGERLLLTAQRLVGDLTKVEAEVEHLAGTGVHQSAIIGQQSYASLHWLPGFFEAARTRLPDLQVEAEGSLAETGLARLAAGDVDLLLLAGNARPSGVSVMPLALDSLVAVAPPDHPWRPSRRCRPRR